MNTQIQNSASQEKLLLMTLPFLTPLIPPLGISCLKSYLQERGFKIKTADGMGDLGLRATCYRYFDTLENYIPEKKRGHFFNIALDVLFNHYMAHINYTDESKYLELIEDLVYQNFFIRIDNHQTRTLKGLVGEFYTQLETFLLDHFKKEAPTVLGLSVYKGTLAASVFAARLAKKTCPGIKVFIGGTIFSQDLFPGTPNFERFMERETSIDKVFIGESEQVLVKYLKGELPPEKRIYTLDEVDGKLLELDTSPLPDYSDFNLDVYPLLPAFTSRGCIYRCSFCAETVYWKKYNAKKAKTVVDEFEKMHAIYNNRLFILTDCLINPLATSLSEEMIKRGHYFYWDVYIKVDDKVCEPAKTLRWRQGGFYRSRLGIESGSQRILNIIDKGITKKQIKKALKSLADAGIKTTTYWIAGHPGETEEDFQQTLDLLEELQDSIFEAECDPFRYFHTGQVNADKWRKEKGNQYLYSEDATDMLLMQTYTLNEEPKREVIYERQCRFKEQCKQLGIPNPYSLKELLAADERWKALHKNAVPTIKELTGNKVDLKKDRELFVQVNAENIGEDMDDVGFNF